MSKPSPIEAFRRFRPSGPVSAAFLRDDRSRVKMIRGPVGSGKTVTACFDGIRSSSVRGPVCRDGWVHYKRAVIGVTYGQLERNLHPTWTHWLPKDGDNWTEGEWQGGGGRFAQHSLEFNVVRRVVESGGKLLGPGAVSADDFNRHAVPRVVPVRFEAVFAAIGEHAVEQFMRGFEPSDFYLYEVDQMPEGIVEQAIGRLGRFPNRDMLPDGENWLGYVVGDLNAPDTDSWYYRLMEEADKPSGYAQYVQPSGLSPKAENLHNLPPGYYQQLADLNARKKNWVRRFIRNEYGPSGDGEAVFDEMWSDDTHFAKDGIKPLPGRGLLIGLDQGLTQPAAVVAQRSAIGQLRCLCEYVPGRMNARRFAKGLKAEIGLRVPGVAIEGVWADPAGWSGADREAGELAWAEIVAEELGVPVQPAPTNEIGLRLQAVEDELTFMVEGSQPALLVSSACRLLRKGFASDYCYPKKKPGEVQARVPVKNLYANPHDALQYLILGERGRYGVVSGKRADARGGYQPRGRSTVMKSSAVLP